VRRGGPGAGRRKPLQKGGQALSDKERATAYWKANLRLITWSLVIWAMASFGFGILLRPLVSGIAIGGTDLGFWFAQQGSILVFLALIFFYAWRMNKLDAEFGVDEE
jgi:putative solute:sodium symporter small subunit